MFGSYSRGFCQLLWRTAVGRVGVKQGRERERKFSFQSKLATDTKRGGGVKEEGGEKGAQAKIMFYVLWCIRKKKSLYEMTGKSWT